jgi:hypothetical protein
MKFSYIVLYFLRKNVTLLVLLVSATNLLAVQAVLVRGGLRTFFSNLLFELGADVLPAHFFWGCVCTESEKWFRARRMRPHRVYAGGSATRSVVLGNQWLVHCRPDADVTLHDGQPASSPVQKNQPYGNP